MTQTTIRCERQAHLWRITIDRPERANALTTAMLMQLDAHLAEAEREADLKALVITGAGERVFSGGADLSELQSATKGDDDRVWDRMARRLQSLPCLTVAMINGACIGGAMTLAIGCDLRVAVPNATFGYPVLKNGVFPSSGDIERLTALVGQGRAKYILLGAQRISATEAQAWGLVERVVEPGQLQSTVRGLIETALQAPRPHLAALKALCNGEKPRKASASST
jgi:enoyl-CoA hydratase/carnithine racemase